MTDDLLDQMAAPCPPWRHYLVGGARLGRTDDGLRLLTDGATAHAYSDAQIDDYQGRPGASFVRQPPLRLRLRARFSHEAGELRGTAGFGFWNYPSAWPPRMPRAVWFFYGSPPGDMPLALGVPGQGWKAATIDTGRRSALVLAPLAPVIVPLLWSAPLYRGLWPPIQRAVGVAETIVPAPLTAWHEYVLEWGERTSRFLVDGRVVLDEAPSPRGPLCFVAWIDNQYLVATPQGRFRWGVLAAPGQQWLEMRELTITET
ncbi:MAG: hypothetical protein WCG26_12110 [Chloroflexales bacterium]